MSPARGAGCAFCAIVAGEAAACVVLAGDDCLGFLDARPLFPGHVLLVPRQHVQTMDELPRALSDSLFWQAGRLSRAVEQAMGAEGTFVAVNNRVSQSVPHLHVHVVPRRRGDGLRGFFWPRQRYADDAEMEATAARIRKELEG